MNKKIFIVCIELNRMAVVNAFECKLHEIGHYKCIMNGVYVVIAEDLHIRSSDLASRIRSWIEDGVKLFVVKSSLEAAWSLSKEDDMWLRTNI